MRVELQLTVATAAFAFASVSVSVLQLQLHLLIAPSFAGVLIAVSAFIHYIVASSCLFPLCEVKFTLLITTAAAESAATGSNKFK